jgi:hypothetical protein
MTSIGPRGTSPTTPLETADTQPADTSSAETGTTSEATAASRTTASAGGGRLGVLSSLAAATPPANVSRRSVRGIVNRVLSGELKLNVGTARKLMKKTARDKSVNLKDELAPLKKLFQGELSMGPDSQIQGDFKPGVQSTKAAQLMMQSFVFNAGEVHQAHGEAKNPKVRQLGDLAAKNASPLASRERLSELLDQYKDTRVSPHASGRSIPFTHDHESNHDIESYFVGVPHNFERHLDSAFKRFFTSEARADQVENDPLKSVREYLEGNYERIR